MFKYDLSSYLRIENYYVLHFSMLFIFEILMCYFFSESVCVALCGIKLISF